MRPYGATRAGAQAPPLPNSVIFCHAIPHKQNNHLHAICPNETNRPRTINPNETVWAAPVCPPERPRSGVSISKTHALYAGNLTMDAPLWGDTGGHTGTAPTHLHHILPRNPTQTKSTVYAQSSPTTSNIQTRRVYNPHTHRGRKCIAHSRPPYLK